MFTVSLPDWRMHAAPMSNAHHASAEFPSLVTPPHKGLARFQELDQEKTRLQVSMRLLKFIDDC